MPPRDGTDPPFGRVSYDAVAGGLVRGMKLADAMVFLVLSAHASAEYLSHPSIETISRLTGLSERSVFTAIKRLVRAGKVQKVPGRGRGHFSVYRLPNTEACFTHSDVKGEAPFTVSGAEKVKRGALKGEARRAEKVKRGALKGEAGFRGTEENRVREQSKNRGRRFCGGSEDGRERNNGEHTENAGPLLR